VTAPSPTPASGPLPLRALARFSPLRRLAGLPSRASRLVPRLARPPPFRERGYRRTPTGNLFGSSLPLTGKGNQTPQSRHPLPLPYTYRQSLSQRTLGEVV
jgi:hypothetical protein